MGKFVGQRPGRDRRIDPAAGGAGDNAQHRVVFGRGRITLRTQLGPVVERLDQEIHHPGSIGSRRNRAAHHQGELERVGGNGRNGDEPVINLLWRQDLLIDHGQFLLVTVT